MQAMGADLVVFFQAAGWIAEKWFADTEAMPRDLLVVADESGDVYLGLGTNRPSWYGLLFHGAKGAMGRAKAAGFKVKASRSDMRRMGADIVVDANGDIAFLHLAEHADDRVDPAELVAKLGLLPN
jgi:hypothetical protein